MRFFSFARWRARELFLSWIVYWLGLAAFTLGPLASALWTVAHAPHGGPEGNVSLSVSNTVFTATVKLGEQMLYTGSRSLLSLALLIAGPPLVIWLLWVRRRGAPAAERERERVR
jgi:hypothetical protein